VFGEEATTTDDELSLSSRSEMSDKEGANELTEEARERLRRCSFLAATGQYLAEWPLFLQYLQTVCRMSGQVMGLRGLEFMRVQWLV
jgi:hypothetical protein